MVRLLDVRADWTRLRIEKDRFLVICYVKTVRKKSVISELGQLLDIVTVVEANPWKWSFDMNQVANTKKCAGNVMANVGTFINT